MKTNLVASLFLFIAGNAAAQSISGRVLDTEGNGMPFVNVLLLHSKDSALYKGAVTNDAGSYSMDQIRKGQYILSTRMIGYETTFGQEILEVDGRDLKVEEMVMSQDVQQLKEVTVVAARPFIEQAIDRTIVNVANSIVSGGSTALEVLEKSPGVSVDRQNDGLALRGKDGVIVMIDGKQTYLSMPDVVAMLRNMPSDQIDKIELITNPSSRFDAAGNSGIINIVMKKNNNFGTNGSVSLSVGTGRFDRERASLQLNNRSKKVNLFGTYSGSRGGNYWNFDLNRVQRQGEQVNYIENDSYIRFRNNGHNGKIGIDYSLGKNTTVGVVYTMFYSNSQEKSPAYTVMREEGSTEPFLDIVTDKRLSNESTNQIGNINLQHTFEKAGTLSADLDYGRFNRDFMNNLTTSSFLPNSPQDNTGLVTVMPSSIDILTIKTDYSRSLSKGLKLDVGAKRSVVKSDNNMKLSQGRLDEMALDPALSNHFLYTEEVNAVYTSLAGKLGNALEFQAGLRVEHTYSIGESLTLDQEVTRDYTNLFPSLFLSRDLHPKHGVAFSYSYRIDRPNYQSLNPGRSYLDPYAFSRGNPNLKPQYTHAMEIKHSFDKKIFTAFGVNLVQDFVFYLIQPVDAQTSERTPDNIGKSQAYNINISFPITIAKGWTFQGNVMGIYSILHYQYLGTPLTLEQVNGRFNGSNSFVFGKGWTAELSGWLNTPATFTIFRSPWMGSMDAGIQKAVNKKLKVKLNLQDVFKTNFWRARGQAAGYEQDAHLTFDTRIVMLNVNYAFGNQQMKAVRQRKTASSEEQQRAGE